MHSVPDFKWSELEDDTKSVNGVIEQFIDSNGLSSESSMARPPIHFVLMRNSSSGLPRLLVIIHHALYDGISVVKLREHVLARYRREEVVRSLQFHDLVGDIVDQEERRTKFWVGYLSGLPRPIWFSGTERQERYYAASCRILVSSSRAKETAMRCGVTVSCLGQAVMAEMLAQQHQRSDVVFGHVLSGRTTEQADTVIGPLIVCYLLVALFGIHQELTFCRQLFPVA